MRNNKTPRSRSGRHTREERPARATGRSRSASRPSSSRAEGAPPKSARPRPGEGDPRAQVVALLDQGGKPMTLRELTQRLGLKGEARHELKDLLRKMTESGEVVKIRGARVGLPMRMNLLAGRLQCSPSGYGFVIPEERRPGQGDVFVAAVNMSEALHGDRVLVRIERAGVKGPEGRIIRVLERGQQRLVGRFEGDGRFGGHVVPFDKRVLHELYIPSGEEGEAKAGDMVQAEITRPPTASRNPLGRVLRVLGRLEDPGVDMKVVLAKYDLPEHFPPEVEAEAAAVPQEVRDQDRAGRSDFRDWLTVTIDPETARDHDDAISLTALPGGQWRLAVHIADVAHYVPEGSALDQEAYARGTSVYFPDRVIPMLPHALSSNICSLVDGQDRLTQTVVMEVDAGGRVKSAEFHDGVIRSAARLSYQQVQAVVDGDASMRRKLAPFVERLLQMDGLARLMRKRRYERGSLDFDLPEPKLVLDEKGEVVKIVASERLDSMRLIEEFMLAANEAVAQELSDAGVAALYRIHEQPDPEKVEEFTDLVSSFGYRLPRKLEDIRPQDFQGITRQIQGKPEEKLISYLLLRTMKLARYFEENLGHFGLATSMYAHFTSPIRRYPDLVVHRALRAHRRGLDPEQQAALREALPEMGRHLSEREKTAADAERELIEWKKVRYMSDKVGEAFGGYVTGVKPFGLFVELTDVYVQGLVHVSTMSDDYYAFNERAHLLRGENTGKVYRLGDRVEVQVARVDLEQRKVEFVLAGVVRHPSPRQRGGAAPPRTPRSRRSAG